MPWRRIFRELSKAYGWTPEQIGEMTLAQIFVYWRDASDPGGEVTFDLPWQAAMYGQNIARQREWWERQLLRQVYDG